ncbi:MAG: hypothetical protein JNK15_13215, partial [Planctomycetes bacterium]|nr:hypothetical protein [Planctomycetota bacterium]
WVANAEHADHEIVVEWKPVDASKDHHGGLWVAFTDDAARHGGLRVLFHRRIADPTTMLEVVTYEHPNWKTLGHVFVDAKPQADGFHRLAARVSGSRLAVLLDNAPALEVDAGHPLKGRTGVLAGMIAKAPSCPVRYRNLRIDPLPADQPSDEQVRANAEAESRDAITKAVTEGKALLAQKQPEAASLRLRDALARIDEMAPGILRDNLRKTIDPLLLQADPLTPKRRKTAQAIGAELGALADRYAEAGMPRAGLALATHAANFDPETQAARVAALRDKVRQWNIAQATARAGELAPPADDGTALRDWFGKGRKLIAGTADFVLDGAVARAGTIPVQTLSVWTADPNKPKLAKASVYVQPLDPKVGAGLCCDFVDQTDYTIVLVERGATGLRLRVERWAAQQWIELAVRTVPLDAWRLDGWFQLTVESTEQGLTVQCADTEVKLPRKQLGKPVGTFGLVVANFGKQAAACELRAFQPGP